MTAANGSLPRDRRLVRRPSAAADGRLSVSASPRAGPSVRWPVISAIPALGSSVGGDLQAWAGVLSGQAAVTVGDFRWTVLADPAGNTFCVSGGSCGGQAHETAQGPQACRSLSACEAPRWLRLGRRPLGGLRNTQGSFYLADAARPSPFGLATIDGPYRTLTELRATVAAAVDDGGTRG